VRRRLARVAVAPLVLPHELAHVLPAVLAGLPVSVTLLPDVEVSGTPLGRFDAAIDARTPRWIVSLVALAPLPTFLAVAVLLRLARPFPTPVAVVAVAGCAAWGSLSAGDLAVASKPGVARRGGGFTVEADGWESAAADALTVATTAAVGVAVLV
jgi:hypothetical protein